MNITPAALEALSNGDIKNFTVASTAGGIEEQEKEGQDWFCSQSLFPKEHLYCEREYFEKLEIKYLSDYDDIFVNIELPENFKFIPQNDQFNSYYSFLM